MLVSDWLTNLNPVFEDLDEINRESELYEKRNYCEYGHYEEFDLDDPTWPRCKNVQEHEEYEDE